MSRCVYVSKFCYCCCCLQIQLVYGVNYAKNVPRNGIEPFLTFFAAPLPFHSTVWALISILQYKHIYKFRCWKIYGHCYIFAQFIHIPACTQKERAYRTRCNSLPLSLRDSQTHTDTLILFALLFCFVSLRCVYSYLGSHKFHSFASCAKNKNKTERSEKRRRMKYKVECVVIGWKNGKADTHRRTLPHT